MVLRDIAVGIDGSATAADGLAWAAGLARESGASVQVIHAWETPFVCTYPGLTPSTQESTQHARSLVRSAIETAGGDQCVESVVVHGAAGPALVTAAVDADLLVIGRTGENLTTYRPKFGELMTGATARYCVNHSKSAVAAVPTDAAWIAAPQVLVGVDGSAASLAALRWALENLPTSASIHALTAANLPRAEFGTPVDVELLDPIVDEHRRNLQQFVDETVRSISTGTTRTVQIHTVVGYAQDALTDPGFPCDLIVIGEHGDTAAAPGVLGSIADHTLRHARVPLVVVPAGPADR